MSRTILRVEKLKKRFGGVTAVNGPSFDVPTGAITGLIGPNGSGKTTVGRAILRLIEPTDGQVLFEGQDLARLDEQAVRRSSTVRAYGALLLRRPHGRCRR